MMNRKEEKYRKTGLLVMLLTGVCHLIVSLIFWFVIIITARESPWISAVIMGLLWGLPPLVITGITRYWLPIGSMIAIGLSLIVLVYWIFYLVIIFDAANPFFAFSDMPLAALFLTGSVLFFISSRNFRSTA
jgi:hypothetical protein